MSGWYPIPAWHEVPGYSDRVKPWHEMEHGGRVVPWHEMSLHERLALGVKSSQELALESPPKKETRYWCHNPGCHSCRYGNGHELEEGRSRYCRSPHCYSCRYGSGCGRG